MEGSLETAEASVQSQAEKVDQPRDKWTNVTFMWRQIGVQCSDFLQTLVISTWHHGSLGDLVVSEDYQTSYSKAAISETHSGDCTRHAVEIRFQEITMGVLQEAAEAYLWACLRIPTYEQFMLKG